MTTIIAAGPVEYLDLVFWTINNKIAATGKCYFGIFEGVGRADRSDDQSVESVELHIRDRVSLHDAVFIANMMLDQIGEINELHSMREEVRLVDGVVVTMDSHK